MTSKNWGKDFMLSNKNQFKKLQDFHCNPETEEKQKTNKTPKKKKRK